MNYDDLTPNLEILLDLPVREGVGIITQDEAKPHHPMVMVNTPDWATLDTDLSVMDLNGTNEYLRCLAANCLDLDFTGSYSLWGWIKYQVGEDSQIVMGRYLLNDGGWELYLYEPTGLLTIRHHHAAGAATRSAGYSDGWTSNAWHFYGISRTAGAASVLMVRNDQSLAVTTSVGGIEDPEAHPAADLVIGVRSSLDANFYKGQWWRHRAAPVALTLAQFRQIYQRERRWFA